MKDTQRRLTSVASLSAHSDVKYTDVVPTDVQDDLARIVLVNSSEPGVVFASLAAQCVPGWCAFCTVDIVDGHSRYRIVDPASESRRTGVSSPDPRILRLPFTVQRQTAAPITDADAAGRADDASGADEAGVAEPFQGVASFGWLQHEPTRNDRLTAALLVDHAVHTVAWQRSDEQVRAVAAKAANLQLALQNSRQIGIAVGILMSLHKITEQQAFEVLSAASQRANRKLRDLARDVVDTGWLDPALVRSPPSVPRAASPGTGRPVATNRSFGSVASGGAADPNPSFGRTTMRDARGANE